MRKKKIITIPERKESREVSIICDWCKSESSNPGDWSKGYYDIEDITIKYESGSNYGPDGGEKNIFTLDLCPTCFKENLMPLLESKNIYFSTEKRYW